MQTSNDAFGANIVEPSCSEGVAQAASTSTAWVVQLAVGISHDWTEIEGRDYLNVGQRGDNGGCPDATTQICGLGFE